jgi:type II secretory pathway pseudopilin PulG
MNKFKNKRWKSSREGGLSLVEAMVALIIFGGVLSAMMPLFVTYSITTVKNDLKIGGMAVSQRVMDELRQAKIKELPSAGKKTELPSGTSTTSMEYKGAIYRVEIEYCNPNTNCDENTRQIKVSAFHGSNTNPVFQLETVYTQLKDEA